MENRTQEENSTIYITNITWHTKQNVIAALSYKQGDLPAEYSLSIPGYLADLRLAKDIESQAKFKDEIETFVYNFLTKKFGVECSSCQIFLPLDDK